MKSKCAVCGGWHHPTSECPVSKTMTAVPKPMTPPRQAGGLDREHTNRVLLACLYVMAGGNDIRIDSEAFPLAYADIANGSIKPVVEDEGSFGSGTKIVRFQKNWSPVEQPKGKPLSSMKPNPVPAKSEPVAVKRGRALQRRRVTDDDVV